MSRKKEIIISLSLTGAVLAYSTVSLFAPAYAHVEQTSIWAGRIPDAQEQPDQKDLLVTGGQTILLNTLDGRKKIPLEIPEGGLVTLTVSDPHWIEAEIQTDDEENHTLVLTSPLWQEIQEETEEPADGENPDGEEGTDPSEDGTEDTEDSSDTSGDGDTSTDDSKDTSKDTDGSEDASDDVSQDTSDDASEGAGSTKADNTGKKDADTKVLGESLKTYLPLLNNKTVDADKTSGTAASEDSGATAGTSGTLTGDKTGTSSTGTAGATTGDKTGTGTTGTSGTTGDKTGTGTTGVSGTDVTGDSGTTTGDKTSTDTDQAGTTSNGTRDGMEMRPDHEWLTVTWTQNAGSLVKSATFDLGVSVDEDAEAADKKTDAGSETDNTKDNTKDNTDGANSGTGADSTGTEKGETDGGDVQTGNTKSGGTDASAKTEQKTTIESLAPIVQAEDSQKSVSSQSTGAAAQGNNAAKSTARLTMGISVVPKKETKTYAGSGLILTHVSSYDPKIGILVTAGEEGAVVLCNGAGFPAGTRYTEDGMTYFLYEEAPLRLAPSAMAVINLSMTDISGDLTLSAGEGCEVTLGQQDLDLDENTDVVQDDTTLTGQNTVKPVGTVVTPEQALIVGDSGQKVAVVSIPDAVLDVESVERLETVEQGTAWVPDDTVIASMDTGSTLYLKPRDSAAGTYRVTLVWSQGGQAIYRKSIPFYIFYAEGEEHE
jgi:hypothetical protein